MKIDYPTVARAAHALGHDGRVVQKRPSVWVFSCTCGYRAAKRRTSALALEAGVHHVLKEIDAWTATGRPLPSSGDTPTEHLSEGRHLRLA